MGESGALLYFDGAGFDDIGGNELAEDGIEREAGDKSDENAKGHELAGLAGIDDLSECSGRGRGGDLRRNKEKAGDAAGDEAQRGSRNGGLTAQGRTARAKIQNQTDG